MSAGSAAVPPAVTGRLHPRPGRRRSGRHPGRPRHHLGPRPAAGAGRAARGRRGHGRSAPAACSRASQGGRAARRRRGAGRLLPGRPGRRPRHGGVVRHTPMDGAAAAEVVAHVRDAGPPAQRLHRRPPLRGGGHPVGAPVRRARGGRHRQRARPRGRGAAPAADQAGAGHVGCRCGRHPRPVCRSAGPASSTWCGRSPSTSSSPTSPSARAGLSPGSASGSGVAREGVVTLATA